MARYQQCQDVFLLTRCPPNLLKYFIILASGFHLIPQSENHFHFGAMGINSALSANLSNGMDLQLIQFTLNIFILTTLTLEAKLHSTFHLQTTC